MKDNPSTTLAFQEDSFPQTAPNEFVAPQSLSAMAGLHAAQTLGKEILQDPSVRFHATLQHKVATATSPRKKHPG